MTVKSSIPYQPVSTGGLFGLVSRLFGSTTPVYQGVGQPPPASGGLAGSLFGGTPVYRTGGASPTSGEPTPTQTDTDPTYGASPDGQSAPLMIVIQRD